MQSLSALKDSAQEALPVPSVEAAQTDVVSESLESSLTVGESVRGFSFQQAELWRAEDGRRSYRLRIRNDSASDVLSLAIEFKMSGMSCAQGLRIQSFVGGAAIPSHSVSGYSIPSGFIPTETSPKDFPPMTVTIRYVQRADGTSDSMDSDSERILRLGAKNAIGIAKTIVPLLASAESDTAVISRLEQIQLRQDVENYETLRLLVDMVRRNGRTVALKAAERLAAMPIKE